MTALCDLPEDEPVTPEEFVERTDHIVELAAKSLCQQSINVELAVFDLIKVTKYFSIDSNCFKISVIFKNYTTKIKR